MKTYPTRLWTTSMVLACVLAGCATPNLPRAAAPVAPPLAPPVAVGAQLPTPTPESTDAQPIIAPVPASPESANQPTPAQQALLAKLRNLGPAPELLNDTWLNSAPLKLADLRGKVVMVEFWTFG